MHAITDEDWPTFQQLMRDYRRGKLRPRPDRPQQLRQQQLAPGATVALLKTLNNGESVPAELLAYDELSEGYDIQVVGFANDPNMAFTLNFNNQTTQPIPILATADQLRQILVKIPEAAANLLSVSLGNDPPSGHYIMRWRLKFGRPPADRTGRPTTWGLQVAAGGLSSQAEVQAAPCRWHGTGERITVNCALPVGTPSPLRIGAQGCVLRMSGGWGLVALEARKFVEGITGDYGYSYSYIYGS